MIGAIEAGGTRFRLARAVATGDEVRLLEREDLVTGEPGPTLQRVREFFAKHPVERIGVACFGPIDLSTGVLGRTPKEAWRGVDLHDAIREPIVLETDVNAAAIAEAKWGAGRGADPLVYVTMGTGVGGGLIVDGAPLHGAMHPEMGHLSSSVDDEFSGVCPFHRNCIEGLASGPAILARTGMDPATLPDDHPVWETVGAHLGELAVTVALVVSAERVVVGGSVGRRQTVLAAARRWAHEKLAGYLPWVDEDPARVIQLAEHEDAGLLGAAWLAHCASG